MELTTLGIIIGLIVVTNSLIVGLSTAFLLGLIFPITLAIYKLILTAKHPLLYSFLRSSRAPWMEKMLIDRRVIKILRPSDREENYFCLYCQDRPCFKHGPADKIDLFPERKILVNTDLNRLIEDCINSCLEEVEILNTNPSLNQEVRRCISYMIANLVTRISQNVNPTQLISSQLLTILTQHLNLFILGKRKAKSALFVPNQVIEEYKRGGFYYDVSYLHSVVKSFQHLIIPPKITSQCTTQLLSLEILINCILEPFVDLISHPYYFNSFFILLFSGLSSNDVQSHPVSTQSSSSEQRREETISPDRLEFLLQSFTDPIVQSSESHFGISLKEVIKNEQSLFTFVQFLKEEGAIKFLHFILSVDEFNSRLLQPDLSDTEKSELSSKLELILSQFFDEKSPEYIYFEDASLKKSLEDVLANEDIALLQTKDPLYKAYDLIYNVVDRTFLPLFIQSSFYFKLCVGGRSLVSSPSSENCEEDRLSISSQISSTNGQCKKSYTFDDFKEQINKNEDAKSERDEQVVHDLSSWRVRIDRVERSFRSSPTSFDEDYIDDEEDKLVYLIRVNDIKIDDFWEVQRGFDEFHVLQSKLRQFHGNIKGIDFQLPKKRMQLFSTSSSYSCTSSNLDLLESYKQDLQKFLELLLSNHVLHSSSLLHSFLNPSSSPSHFNSNNIDFKHMIKNLNSSLMLKSGSDLKNYLLPFIMNLVNSTLSKQTDEEIEDENNQNCNDLPQPRDRLSDHSNHVNDEASPPTDNYLTSASLRHMYKIQASTPSDPSNESENFEGNSFYSLVLFVLEKIYALEETSSCLLHLIKICRPILEDTLQLILHTFINRRLESLMTLENFIHSFETLRNSLRSRKTSSNGMDERYIKITEAQAFKAIQSNLQNYVPFAITSSLSFHLYYCFQFKIINKQFIYLLLNHLFKTLFPESFG